MAGAAGRDVTPAPVAGPVQFDAWIALGANLGDGPSALQQAARALASVPGIQALAGSSLYRTAPVEASGPDFTNAVMRVATTLGPLELLHVLQAQEARQGRERLFHNAPRTLDLDLIWHGDLVLHTPELTLPHPRYRQRAFVLEPLAEVLKALLADRNTAPESWPDLPDMAVRRALAQTQGLEKLPQTLFSA